MSGELEQFEVAAAQLAAAAFPHDEPGAHLADSLIARLCEESGEVAREVRRYWKQRFGHPGDAKATSAEVAAEIGDLLFVTVRLADLCGVNLDEAQEAVLAKFRRRLEREGRGPAGARG